MRVAYADPPYIGQAKRYPEKQEVDHKELIDMMCREYDAWALSASSPSLKIILPLCPDNCWVGVTATSTGYFMQACSLLEYPVQAKIKYISLEPLLDWEWNWTQSYLDNTLKRADIFWLIIGACTGTRPDMIALCQRNPGLTPLPLGRGKWTAQPKIEWVQEIVEAADKAGIKVFLKDNLRPLLPHLPESCIAWAGTGEGTHRILRQEMPE